MRFELSLDELNFNCHLNVLSLSCNLVIADYNNIGKFLNRILGMEVHQQNALFQYFADTLTAVVQNAKKNGRYDMGILGKWENILNVMCVPDKMFFLHLYVAFSCSRSWFWR